MRRRLRFAVIIVISQCLLVALAITWFIHMVLIAVNGSVLFVERAPAILWSEIISTVLIIMFGIYVLVVQIKKLGERRTTDINREFDNNTAIAPGEKRRRF